MDESSGGAPTGEPAKKTHAEHTPGSREDLLAALEGMVDAFPGVGAAIPRCEFYGQSNGHGARHYCSACHEQEAHEAARAAIKSARLPVSAVKHTPGPWKVVRDSKSVLLEVRGDNMTRVAEVWTDTEGGQERRVANADLVAAAPDLLAACERALSSGAIKFADNALDLGIREVLTAAIAKARGGA